MLVVPRLACPSWRWMTLSGTPSRASSTAWAWRRWCGEQRPPPRIEVALAQRERLLDTEPGAPEHDDQRPQASAVAIVGSSAHHRDDLLDGRRVGGIELPLVWGRATGVVARHGCGRSPPTGGIERSRDGH